MEINDTDTFTFLNHQKLCNIISTAKRHIIYAAPSVSKQVAESLCTFAEQETDSDLRVIVDDDAEPFRLGFGEYEGLDLLLKSSVDVRRAAGLQIAVLIADEKAWIYAPTPEFIFEQPLAGMNNAIKVSVDFANEILLSAAPDISLKSHDELLNDSVIADGLTPEIGKTKITSRDLQEIQQDLTENPPQKFDAARKVRVYQGYFQFVELRLSGCRINSHTINIPESLMSVSESDDLRNRIKTTCRLIEENSDVSAKVKAFESRVNQLRKNFIKSLGNRYGTVILRRSRNEFDIQVDLIRKDLKIFSGELSESLEAEITKTRETLIGLFLPGIKSNPPPSLKNNLFMSMTDEIGKSFIADELDKYIPKVKDLVEEMTLNCDYKDITFEMLNDEEFIKLVEEKYPYNNFTKLYTDEDAIGKRFS